MEVDVGVGVVEVVVVDGVECEVVVDVDVGVGVVDVVVVEGVE